MKVKITDDIEIKKAIQKSLRNNEGYCPGIANSKGNLKSKCMCEDFLNNVPAGQICHCGLYIKLSND